MASHKSAPAADQLAVMIEAWERLDLSAERRVALDAEGLAIADNQEQSAAGREVLKEAVRAVRAVPAEERPGKIGGMIKAFQAEIDALTRRQSSAESSFLGLYRSLDDAPDPLPAMREAAAKLASLGAAAAEADGLRRELAELDAEFQGLKNQDATIRRLQQQLRDAEARADAAREEAAAEAPSMFHAFVLILLFGTPNYR